MLTVGSLFSGVGGFDLGFTRAGFDVRWMCEVDAACQDVLRRNFPDVGVIYTDVRTMPTHLVEPVDVVIGGFPCQDLSVAGRRAGIGGARSGLFFDMARIIRELRPRFAVLENVPGLLSANGGDDFAAVLAELANSGAMDIAWRVLDAQWFGVAQRRRRVFIVCDFGGERAAEILALAEGLSGHPAPRREAGEGITGTLRGGAAGGSAHGKLNGSDQMPMVAASCDVNGRYDRGDGTDSLFVFDNKHVAWGDTTDTLRSGSHGALPMVAHALSAEGADASEDGTGRGTPLVPVAFGLGSQMNAEAELMEPLVHTGGSRRQAVAFAQNQRGELRTSEIAPPLTTGGGTPGEGYSAVALQHAMIGRHDGAGPGGKGWREDGAAWTLDGRGDPDAVAVPMGVRRLMPVECERLQGWPDNFTKYGASGKAMSDSTRYRMIGNGVATPVAEWIARRIVAVAS